MKSSWWFRFVIFILIVTTSILYVIPTAFNFDEETSKYPIKSKINLGLDLQGGLYMIMGVDFEQVFRDEIVNLASRIQHRLNDYGMSSNLGELNTSNPRDPRHSITLAEGVNVDEAKRRISEFYSRNVRLVNESGRTLTYALSNTFKSNMEEEAVNQSIEVIRNRIDEFGVTEPEIVAQGQDRIIIQLPGVSDIERAQDLIGQTARLEFKLVNDQISASTLDNWVRRGNEAGIEFNQGERFSVYINELNEFLRDEIPEGHTLVFERVVNRFTNELERLVPYLVENRVMLDGDALQDARVQFDPQNNQPYVGLDFNPAGARVFEQVTGENVNRRLAIILDGNVYSAPNILSRIGGGRAQITLGSGGGESLLREARDLAVVLRAGALPVQLDFLEQRTVGPSLGQDSIERARFASLVGGAIVLLFIMFYYRVSGVITVTILCVNVLIIMAALVGLGATLTLPGIAGIALTVGMAVDANIIIFERIREEVKRGLSNFKAVENGFNQAFWTIIDANITTALAGLALMNFGTGPIRGFAVTLLIGIAATIYSSYFVGRMIFEFYMNKVEGRKLSI